ncbi:hypothetical protein Emed_001758 [Eimeria media]
MAPSSDLKVCQVCKEEPYKYICPKCKLLYCSLPCYKEHSARCVSAFYESEFAAAAAAAAPTAHEQRAFSKTLTRIHHEQQQQQEHEHEEEEAVKGLGLGSSEEDQALSDDTEDEDSQQQQQQQQQQQEIEPQRLQQLQQLAAAGTLDLEHLTPQEKKAFFSAVKRGELAKYLEPWKPWWLSISKSRVELPVVEEPPHVCCKPTRANPQLAMTLLQTLFNGQIEDLEVQEAASHFLAVARGLELKDAPPASATAAIDQALQWAAQPPLGCTDSAFCEVCLSDVSRLLSARDFALKATEDAAALVKRFKHLMLQQQQQQQQQEQQKQQREGGDVETPTPKQLGRLAFYFHWQELLPQQQQPLLQALRQRAQLLQHLQQIKKGREDAQSSARVGFVWQHSASRISQETSGKQTHRGGAKPQQQQQQQQQQQIGGGVLEERGCDLSATCAAAAAAAIKPRSVAIDCSTRFTSCVCCRGSLQAGSYKLNPPYTFAAAAVAVAGFGSFSSSSSN